MIQANELRVGDIVFPFINSAEVDDDTFVTIIEIGEMCKVEWDGDIMYRHLGDLSPIPLTEEWLLKFGFEKPAHSWIGDILHLSEWDEYPLNWCVAMNKNGAVLIKKLQYVHQLQNLYFALTGQELKRKDNE